MSQKRKRLVGGSRSRGQDRAVAQSRSDQAKWLIFCEKSPGERRSRGLEQLFENENGRFYVEFLSVQHGLP
jgi:hypothetical protein